MPEVILPMGPCIIDWDDGTVIFKKTRGGVIFRYEELQVPVKEDQQGETDIDDVTAGAVNPTLEVPMTNEDLDNLNYCFANSEAASNLKVANPVGEAILSRAKKVIVKPIVNGVISTTASQWVFIHKAFPRVTEEWNYDNANQRVTTVIFKGYPVNLSGQKGALFRVSDA